MSSPSLEAVDLSKSYGDFAALSQLNLKIAAPKCVGFLGPNGAGKTTTMKIFTGLIKPSGGTALVNGIDIRKNQKKALMSCVSLIETPEIYPSLTPREALRYVAELRGVPREERQKAIDDSLDKVRMGEWVNKKVGSFSKGMKQRVAIASTLVSDPDVIILDEPTSGLDPRGMSEVRDIVRSLDDRLVFMSSHLLGEVTDVCQEVAMIDHGKLIVYDTIPNVTAKFGAAGSELEVGFSGSVDQRAVDSLSELPGVQGVRRTDGSHVVLTFKGALKEQQGLMELIVGLKIGAVSFKEASGGLEEVYLKLIKEAV